MKNRNIVILTSSLIVGFSIVGYGYFGYKKEILIQKQIAEKERQTKLQNCIDELQQSFVKGVKDMGNIDYLSADETEVVLDVYWKEREECYKKYLSN